jgi:hypothetical protein
VVGLDILREGESHHPYAILPDYPGLLMSLCGDWVGVAIGLVG